MIGSNIFDVRARTFYSLGVPIHVTGTLSPHSDNLFSSACLLKGPREFHFRFGRPIDFHIGDFLPGLLGTASTYARGHSFKRARLQLFETSLHDRLLSVADFSI